MPTAYNQALLGGAYRIAPGDYSPGILRFVGALGGGGAQASADRILGNAASNDLHISQTALNVQKIRDMMDEAKRRAEFDNPNSISDVVSALSGATPEQTSAAIRHFGGQPLRLPSDFPAVPVDAEDPAGNVGEVLAKQSAMQGANMRPENLDDQTLRRIGRVYGTTRMQRQAGGNVQNVAKAIQDALQTEIMDEQAGLARAGQPGTVSSQNRLGAARSPTGAAYEPYSTSGQYGPHNQETGALARPEVFESAAAENRAQAGAAGALARERGAKTEQIGVETTNLRERGVREPGRATGGKESDFERKRARWLEANPNDYQGALEYARGTRPFRASDARRIAGNEAKAKGLTGTAFDDYVANASAEIIAANKGDKAGEARARINNATAAVRDQARSIKRKKPADQAKEITAIAADLKARGFDLEEAETILRNAGL